MVIDKELKQAILEEYELIQQKKSKLCAKHRAKIVKLVEIKGWNQE